MDKTGIYHMPNSEKVWWGESLANRLGFTKLKPFKLVLTINTLLADPLISQTFFHQRLKKSQFAKLSLPAKLSCYTIHILINNMKKLTVQVNNYVEI